MSAPGRLPRSTPKALAYLRDVLADGGWHPSTEVIDGRPKNVSVSTLNRARSALAVRTQFDGQRHHMRLPEHHRDVPAISAYRADLIVAIGEEIHSTRWSKRSVSELASDFIYLAEREWPHSDDAAQRACAEAIRRAVTQARNPFVRKADLRAGHRLSKRPAPRRRRSRQTVPKRRQR